MRLKKVIFDNNGFRGLRNLEIDISPRITVIAGHNGIGKSTILGIIANGSEFKGSRNQKTILNKNFRSDFSEIFFLDYQGDFEREPQASSAKLIYEADDVILTKNCTVTAGHKRIVSKKNYKPFLKKVNPKDLTEKQKKDLDDRNQKNPDDSYFYVYRVRLIPRTKDIQSPEGKDNTNGLMANAAKLEIPTLYLGMSRVYPIGEFADHSIIRKKTNIEDGISDFIKKFFNDVIPYDSNEDGKLYSHSFSETNKQSLVPELDHSSLTISLGQDSLSSIATAFASFKALKDVMQDTYPGGILIIDEIEAGLHPKAQLKLMSVVRNHARHLKLQVIVTSHSLTIIKDVLDNSSQVMNNPNKLCDSVVYLMDTRIPRLMEDPTYSKIKADMLLERTILEDTSDRIKVYFEDDEAKYFFEKLLEFKGISSNSIDFGSKFETISLKVGCEVLIKLVQVDNYFNKAVLIADNDVASKQSNRSIINRYRNLCCLPCSKDINANSPSYLRNPEMLIYKFIEKRLKDPQTYHAFWNNARMYTTDYISEHIINLSANQQQDRNCMKKWFNNNKNIFDELHVMQQWCEENNEAVDKFFTELSEAFDEAIRA